MVSSEQICVPTTYLERILTWKSQKCGGLARKPVVEQTKSSSTICVGDVLITQEC